MPWPVSAETGSGSERQRHQHGHQNEWNIFGRQDLPAGYGQQTVACRSAIAVQRELQSDLLQEFRIGLIHGME